MTQRIGKIALVVVVAALIASFFVFDLGMYFNLEFIKAQRDAYLGYYQQNPATTITAYAAIYIAVTALSLPGAAIMTLLGGALFGVITGTIIVSFCSTIGATLAFLVARFLLRDSIQGKFGDRLETINNGIANEGMFYLFTMRLIPVIPFFVINLVMGLTPIRTVQFFFVSQLGMFPGTIVYVNAGTQLAQIDSLAGILSPTLLLSFALLGLFPLIAKKSIELVNKRRNAKAP
ncbi:MAG: TVP38/TMEM64 family protein [Deltaproteobacteria bacterium]|nr:TVP38/TMEM64 family protein [Deltaproteobacteria bacterium]